MRRDIAISVNITFANLVEIGIAERSLHRIRFDPAQFGTANGVIVFMLIASIGAPLFSATVALASQGGADGFAVWMRWYVTNALGMAIVAPAALQLDKQQFLEVIRSENGPKLAMIVGAIAVVAALSAFQRVFLYLAAPLILLFALQVGFVGVTFVVVSVFFIGIILVFTGTGAVVIPNLSIPAQLTAHQVFVFVNILWALPISAALRASSRQLAQVSSDNARLSIEHVQQSQALADLRRHLASAGEVERRHLARELHDETGQSIAILMLTLKEMEPFVAPQARGNLQTLRDTLEDIGKTMHRIALQLRPTAIDDCGLVQALQTYVDQWSRRSGICADFLCTDPDIDRLPDDVRVSVYRIVQEALNNIARHAVGARNVSVVIETIASVLHLTIEDDGGGFDTEARLSDRVLRDGGHLGLAGMRERAELLGGQIKVQSSPGAGTTIFGRIPVGQAVPR